MKIRWLRNTDGKEDAVLTMAFMGFLVVLAKVFIGDVSITFDGNIYTFAGVDATVVGALLTPTLGAYVTRRWTDKKYSTEGKPLDTRPQKNRDERDDDRESIR